MFLTVFLRNLNKTGASCCLRVCSSGLLLSILLGLLPVGTWAQALTLERFSTANGLPQNKVVGLTSDQHGRLWGATLSGGAFCYDGHRFQTFDESQGMPDSDLHAIALSSNGTAWFGLDRGIAGYHAGRVRLLPNAPLWDAAGLMRNLCVVPKPGGGSIIWAIGSERPGLMRVQVTATDTLVTYLNEQQLGFKADPYSHIAPGPAGQVWIGTPQGLRIVDAISGRARPDLIPAEFRTTPVRFFFRVDDRHFWIGGNHQLVQLWQAAPGQPWQSREYPLSSPNLQINNLTQDRAGQVWVGHGLGQGLSRLDPGTGHVEYYNSHNGLGQSFVIDMFPDREGNVWLCLTDGLGLHRPDERFVRYDRADGLPADNVLSVAVARPGVFYVGTSDGLARFEPDAAPGQRVRPVALPPAWVPAATAILRLWPDRRGGIWVSASFGHIGRYNPATSRWEEPPALQGLVAIGITEDRRGRLWIRGEDDYLTCYDPGTGRIRRLRASSGPGFHPVSDALRAKDGTVWVTVEEWGLLRLDDATDELQLMPGIPAGLALRNITQDGDGQLWLSVAGRGLCRYDVTRQQLLPPRTTQRGPAPNALQADHSGHLWLGSRRGLDCYTIATGQRQHFGAAEGFTGLETSLDALALDSAGRVWAGTVRGLVGHDARRARANPMAPPVLITSLRGLRGRLPLRPNLVLDYRQNQVSFGYVGVSLTNGPAVRYRYRLVGLQSSWQPPTSQAEATFTNLAPGNYTFEVRAANSDGVWSAQPARFAFRVQPPWYGTWWAYLGYVILFGLTVLGVRRYTQRRERETTERQLERQALLHLQELDRVKTDFFTNVSHELRTPLTLILGPAEMLATEPADAAVREQGGLVLRNAQRLLALINRLLDLSKLEAGALRLLPTSGDAARTVRQLVAAFESLAESRGITLHFEAPVAQLPLVFDEAKLEDILTNLLANALRFTPASGEVWVRAAHTATTATSPQGGVSITVQDSGVGIAAADLPYLFDRFYQASAPTTGPLRTGTGIGLALVRELTELHGGTVAASSTPGAGTTFTVWLPAGLRPVAEMPPSAAASLSPVESVAAELAVAAEVPSDLTPSLSSDADLVLIVEDSAEIREFIRTTLAVDGYRLLLADDGAAGVALAQAEVPDLVVSDVMMPGLDGYQMCAQLKTNPATSHIPVVLLTAKSGPEARLEGLETGADSFLAKPFAPRELRAQVRNLLALRRQVRARVELALQPVNSSEELSRVPDSGPTVPDPLAAHVAAVATLPSADQKFLNRLNELILQHLDDEDFGVDQLGQEIGLSRTQLHRKLKAITGQSPGDCIRQTRLLRALALLQARVGTVAEVAYQVGFSSPNHFSTAFSKQFGYPPSAVGKGDAA